MTVVTYITYVSLLDNYMYEKILVASVYKFWLSNLAFLNPRALHCALRKNGNTSLPIMYSVTAIIKAF